MPVLRVLYAEDDPVMRAIGARILREVGHDVEAVPDGLAAVAAFTARRHDLCLLDLGMPGLDGADACREIKAIAGDAFTPVLYVSGASDEELLHAVDAGGDGFLHKPFTPIALRAALAALTRIRALHHTQAEQAAALRAHHERARADEALAARIMTKVMEPLDQSRNVELFHRPATILGGDLALTAVGPSGSQWLFVGDVTGHGLASAVATVPAAELFQRRVVEGIDLPTLVRELNARVRGFLPDGMFLAAVVAEIDVLGGRIAVWNGGLPDAQLVDPVGGGRAAFPSTQPPLGLLEGPAFDATPMLARLRADDVLVVYTDGLEEVLATHEDAQWHDLAARVAAEPPAHLRPRIIEAMGARRDAGAQYDDATLVLLRAEAPRPARQVGGAPLRESPSAPHATRLEPVLRVRFGSAYLRARDPLALITQAVTDVPALAAHRDVLCLVINELLLNALQHGVLGVSSALKEEEDGFARYDAAVAAQRARLADGWITIEIDHGVVDGLHQAEVRIEDSGAGFDPAHAVPDPLGLSGRGIGLVRALTDALEFTIDGTGAACTLSWGGVADVAA
ncbi:MAG: fused response regulator/phosphatase [Gemmatimonadaceae bacterium]|nr:fused response regulator/phosphatase [Gemmatimonadaceae bacterium]